MPTPPRNSTQSRNSSASRNGGSDTRDIHFLENEAACPVNDFLDEKVYAFEGGKVIDFRYDKGESKRPGADGKPRQKVSFLTVKMPKMHIQEGILLPADEYGEDGEVTKEAPMVNVTIRASYEANEVLWKQKGKGEHSLDGINVSTFYATDQATGKETGEVGFMLTVASGESADLSALGLRR